MVASPHVHTGHVLGCHLLVPPEQACNAVKGADFPQLLAKVFVFLRRLLRCRNTCRANVNRPGLSTTSRDTCCAE
eukprot:2934294-Pyramimonas_sp.AAC.1